MKAANILYDGSHIKLTDFGESRILKKDTENLKTSFEKFTLSHSGMVFPDIKGSLLWMAPEVIKGAKVGRRSDIWSLGCTLIELATAGYPWPDIKDLQQLFIKLVKEEIPEIPEHLS